MSYQAYEELARLRQRELEDEARRPRLPRAVPRARRRALSELDRLFGRGGGA